MIYNYSSPVFKADKITAKFFKSDTTVYANKLEQ